MKNFHIGVLIASIVSIVLMLLPKIFIDHKKNLRKYNEYSQKYDSLRRPDAHNRGLMIGGDQQEPLIDEGFQQAKEEPKKEGPKFSEAFVNVIIETIEFVLGAVSNTASYLRLWALSLAHSQLSVVFFEKTIRLAATATNYAVVNIIILIPIFFIFAGITIFVLLLMDLMECFLHTLRLHWVEFQNKFYKADGYEFNPFCFKKIVES